MKAWVYGDDVDTDAIAPGAYMKLGYERRHNVGGEYVPTWLRTGPAPGVPR